MMHILLCSNVTNWQAVFLHSQYMGSEGEQKNRWIEDSGIARLAYALDMVGKQLENKIVGGCGLIEPG